MIALVERGIADAKVEAISADLRFIAAFGAALAAATIALRACGYRTKTQSGHHQRTVECLEFTIGADAKLISKMITLSKKRNATAYDAAGNVSGQELELIIRVAEQLQREVLAWLKKNYPKLVQ
jgi:hypothetical protein